MQPASAALRRMASAVDANASMKPKTAWTRKTISPLVGTPPLGRPTGTEANVIIPNTNSTPTRTAKNVARRAVGRATTMSGRVEQAGRVGGPPGPVDGGTARAGFPLSVGLGVLVDELPPGGDGDEGKDGPLDGIDPTEAVAG